MYYLAILFCKVKMILFSTILLIWLFLYQNASSEMKTITLLYFIFRISFRVFYTISTLNDSIRIITLSSSDKSLSIIVNAHSFSKILRYIPLQLSTTVLKLLYFLITLRNLLYAKLHAGCKYTTMERCSLLIIVSLIGCESSSWKYYCLCPFLPFIWHCVKPTNVPEPWKSRIMHICSVSEEHCRRGWKGWVRWMSGYFRLVNSYRNPWKKGTSIKE